MGKFLTVGTDDIKDELFRSIEDTSVIKPKGGLWFTKFDERFLNFNLWVDYMLMNQHILFNKYTSSFKLPCSLVTLKENANILNLDSDSILDKLIDMYPSEKNELFSYEKLARDYDGIYIDINKIRGKYFDSVRTFGVSSLVLFNTKCIEYYQQGVVDIIPYDYQFRDYCDITTYNINIDNIKKYITPTSEDYKELVDTISRALHKYLKLNKQELTPDNISKLVKDIEEYIDLFCRDLIHDSDLDISAVKLSLVHNYLRFGKK